MRSISKRTGITIAATLFVLLGLSVPNAEGGWSDPGSRVANGAAQDWNMTWSGRVDDRVRIRIRGRSAVPITISGRRVSQVNYSFRNSLPNRSVFVRVDKRDGRGSVRVIQQPNRSNNYTAVIEVYDGSGSDDFYRFDVSWDGGFNNNFPNSPDVGQGAEMTWQGRVDDRVRIRIRGRTAVPITISGRRVSQVNYTFQSSLPSRNVYVRVDKRDGRGSVQVTQQPNRSNNYTAVIEVYDGSGGDDFYRFDVSWDGGFNNDVPDNPGLGQGADMTWQGRVDDRVRIRIRGRTAVPITISGRRVSQVSYNFGRSLPNRNVLVRVDKRDGRGSVRVIQQPSRSNNYTAVIEVYDSSGSDDFYRFDVFWDGGFNNNGPNNPDFGRGAEMTWQGRVDDLVRITVRGNAATAYAVRGAYPRDVRYDFRQNLPDNAVRVSVRKRDGRGDIRVIEQPERRNNYSAVIEISDTRRGDDFYAFDLNWDRGFGNNPPNDGVGVGLNWSGSVDDVVWITIQGRQVYSQIRSGQRLLNPRWNFNKTLPRRNVRLSLQKLEGRGSVRIVQQPRSNNNYSAIIEIRDARGGRDNYRILVDW